MTNKLVLDCFEEEEFSLIAINTSLPLYRLMYMINKKLDINFYRLEQDLDFQYDEGVAHFAIYSYFSKDYKAKAFLVANKSKLEAFHTHSTGTLFQDSPQQPVKLLMPELKGVDYLLKIEEENDVINIKTILYELKSIEQITAAYQINQDQIQNSQNLIVE
ncbi:MAG: IPExxxVDY family protein [Flavobacteriaceae bacterium]|nr:IPExxxVDY family protein [Flavobacteriaceae bacterium]